MKKLFTLLALCFGLLSAYAQEGVTYTLKTLTFEDADYVSDSTNYLGHRNWSSLIDNPQYGGTLLYGANHGNPSQPYTSVNYKWYDRDNTFLYSELPLNWNTTMYWGGGHAISNYWNGKLSEGDYLHQLSVYVPNNASSGRNGHGHNGSNNFCVHYGYHDNSGYSAENLPSFKFGDGVARTVDHMYVNLTTYLVNCLKNGNSLTAALGPNDYLKIVASGYLDGELVDNKDFFLANNGRILVTDWSKLDLFHMGDVDEFFFNIVGSNDNGYGLSQPAYFAYDDVAVRFPIEGRGIVANDMKSRKEEAEGMKSFRVIPEYDRKKKVAYATATGDVPEGVTVAFETPNKSGNALKVGTSNFVTISGMPVTCTITGISASVLANLRGGAGRITAKDGDNQFAFLAFHGGTMDEEHGIVNDYGIEVDDHENYVPFTFPNGNYQVSGNDIVFFAENVNIVEKPEFNTTVRVVEYTVYYTDSTTSGITEMKSETGNTAIYNLQGIRIDNPVKGGIYIINGKKVIY
ncbi:DUF4465 domain-containing protein [Prevotella koreensis]|uniref:DUF4465 domain-containing protein n=1 Tax=Prevotella koreensis TaxID=2490854 RepID=UPI003FA02DF0